jgi:hypothetical protein
VARWWWSRSTARCQVVGLHDVEAADRLLELHERAVGGQRLAVLHPDGGGVLRKPNGTPGVVLIAA